jgi:small-conductance mechanosensitive channel
VQKLFENLSNTLGDFGGNIFSLVPVFVVIIVLIAASRLLSWQAQRASGLRFRNQLIMAGVHFIGILVLIIVLPVDTGLRGQLLTLIGIIISVTISLSSSTFLGNALAGVMLKSVRNFRSGDFVQVGDHFGRVSERGLFHTEIQTPSRDLTTLPNLYLATTPVTVVRSSGTIVDATVSLGFDIPHDKIEALLLEAAQNAELTDPFVQVLELGDFSVTYRVAGLLTDTKRLLTFRSRLRMAMLDCLHHAGVEIVSPNFMNVRDFEAHHDFVPEATAPSVPPAADAAVEVIFDKAEEAQSMAEMRKGLAELAAENTELQASIKAAPEKEESERKAKERLLVQAERLERRMARLEKEIAAAEEREKADDD